MRGHAAAVMADTLHRPVVVPPLQPPTTTTTAPRAPWEDPLILIECVDDPSPHRLFSYDGTGVPEHRTASEAVGILVAAAAAKVVPMSAGALDALRRDHLAADHDRREALLDELVNRIAPVAADPAEVERVVRGVFAAIGA
jgi:hypothetical protein